MAAGWSDSGRGSPGGTGGLGWCMVLESVGQEELQWRRTMQFAAAQNGNRLGKKDSGSSYQRQELKMWKKRALYKFGVMDLSV